MHTPTRLTLHNAHDESTSLVTYGKWLLQSPHRYLTDGISGDFQTFYNYLSDLILNAWSLVVHLPPTTTQMLIYGPLLGLLFFIGNHWALKQILPDHPRGLALGGALLLTLGGDSLVGHWVLSADLQAHLTALIHVPYHTIALGTAQSLGWVLFLPTLSLLYLSLQTSTPAWKSVLGGVCLGLLIQTHTLTFLNVAYAHGVYLVLRSLQQTSYRRTAIALWMGIYFLFLISFFSSFSLALSPTLRFGIFLILHYAVPFMLDCLTTLKARHLYPFPMHYFRVYPAALCIALPYLIRLTTFRTTLEAVVPSAVSVKELGVFYAALILAAAPLLKPKKWTPPVLWGFSLLLGTLFLGFNHVWGWNNHSYRFVIHLLFPLTFLALLGLSSLQQSRSRIQHWAYGLLLTWLGGVALMNYANYLLGTRVYVRFASHSLEDQTFLEHLQKHSLPGSYFLTPPLQELEDILGSVAIVNFSQLRGFLPDPRYIADHAREEDRLRILMQLLPNGTQQNLSHPIAFSPWKIRDARIRNSIAHISGISAFGWLHSDPLKSDVFKNDLEALGWHPLDAQANHFWYQNATEPLPGVLAFEKRAEDPQGLRVDFTVREAGFYLFFISVHRETSKIPMPLEPPVVDGQEMKQVTLPSLQADLSQWRIHLTSGHHTYFQEQKKKEHSSEDATYFLTGIQEQLAPRYIEVP